MEISSDSDSNSENFSELNSSSTSYNVDNSKNEIFIGTLNKEIHYRCKLKEKFFHTSTNCLHLMMLELVCLACATISIAVKMLKTH